VNAFELKKNLQWSFLHFGVRHGVKPLVVKTDCVKLHLRHKRTNGQRQTNRHEESNLVHLTLKYDIWW